MKYKVEENRHQKVQNYLPYIELRGYICGNTILLYKFKSLSRVDVLLRPNT